MNGSSRKRKSGTGSHRLTIRWPRRVEEWHPCISPSRVGRMAGLGGKKLLCAPTPARIYSFSVGIPACPSF
jgi:hypothetical protein